MSDYLDRPETVWESEHDEWLDELERDLEPHVGPERTPEGELTEWDTVAIAVGVMRDERYEQDFGGTT
jgi:hypothetical protein